MNIHITKYLKLFTTWSWFAIRFLLNHIKISWPITVTDIRMNNDSSIKKQTKLHKHQQTEVTFKYQTKHKFIAFFIKSYKKQTEVHKNQQNDIHKNQQTIVNIKHTKIYIYCQTIEKPVGFWGKVKKYILIIFLLIIQLF